MSVEHIIIFIVFIVIFYWPSDTLPKKYRSRNCMGRNWKTQFPNSSKEDIRKFLLLFANSFAFSANNKLKFEPNDKLLDIYRELYPSKWMTDALELETLADEVSKRYGVKLNDVWHDNLTLGELYSGVSDT